LFEKQLGIPEIVIQISKDYISTQR